MELILETLRLRPSGSVGRTLRPKARGVFGKNRNSIRVIVLLVNNFSRLTTRSLFVLLIKRLILQSPCSITHITGVVLVRSNSRGGGGVDFLFQIKYFKSISSSSTFCSWANSSEMTTSLNANTGNLNSFTMPSLSSTTVSWDPPGPSDGGSVLRTRRAGGQQRKYSYPRVDGKGFTLNPLGGRRPGLKTSPDIPFPGPLGLRTEGPSYGPGGQRSPLSPLGPCGPLSPWSPLGPESPFGPCNP